MVSEQARNAVEDALKTGRALLKFISANDVNATGGHQAGYYLPKAAWKLYAPFGPVKGQNDKAEVRVVWPDRATNSVVTWYGKKKQEYRLTRFGRNFPWQSKETVGNLLLIVPHSHSEFAAYVFDSEEDFEEVQAGLGIEVSHGWGVYDASKGGPLNQSPAECVDAQFEAFVSALTDFPSGRIFSDAAKKALDDCIKGFANKSLDEQLIMLIDTEYQLFQKAEQQIIQADISKPFGGMEDFLKTANSVMNRRKSRAGRSLENHVQSIFQLAGLQFDAQATIEGEKKPDLLFPGKAEYESESFPTDKLRLAGVKTSCKDRWRQVLNEGSRVESKHIITLQKGISATQLIEMRRAGITLVVPESLHTMYPPEEKHGMKILTIHDFVADTMRIQQGA